MGTEMYQPADRRPIASRERVIWKKLAAFLVARGVSPNTISVLGMLAGIAAGVLFATTGFAEAGWGQRGLWFLAAVGIQLRLLANMLDGMVAVQAGSASQVGELYNEIPDRISDVAIIVGAGYALGGTPWLGYVAACVAVFTAYIRAVGKSVGASDLFVGPMAKPQRMFVLTVVGVLMSVLPRDWQMISGEPRASLMVLGLVVIIVGGLLTSYRRLTRIVRHLRSSVPT